MTFGLTPDGFNKKRLPDEKTDQENALIGAFGDINLQPQSVFGQLVGVYAKAFADLWEVIEDVYYSQYPNTAEGVNLDFLVALNGITRLPALRTRVFCVCEGVEGTLINQGALARQPDTLQNFFAESDTIITRTNSYEVFATLQETIQQIYSIIVNDVTFSYSEPYLIFSELLVTDNEIDFDINGDPITTVVFNTDHNVTINDLITEIESHADVDTAEATSPFIVQFDIDFEADNVISTTINGDILDTVEFEASQAVTIQDLADVIESHESVDTATVTDTREITIITNRPSTISFSVTGGSNQATATINFLGVRIFPVSGENLVVTNLSVTEGATQPSLSRDVFLGFSIRKFG
jgi:hypothetical protein